MSASRAQRLLAPIVEIRSSEVRGALLMFAYAFLLMTSYNIIQPLTRSKLISDLGAVNIPYVLFGSSLIIGVFMVGYTRMVSLLPRPWAIAIVQAGMAGVMVMFWALFQTGGDWVSIAFYLWGLILAILVISQFWTLANGIYDPRQAKRLFGFIGGGVTLGGATGAWTTALLVESVGTNALLLGSAVVLAASVAVVVVILRSERPSIDVASAGEEKGISFGRALELVRGSRQIKLIALVIGFGSIGAALIDQQLNMATEIFKGAGQVDAMGAFLAQVRGWLSLVAFVLQVWVTPRIHRYLGIAFALMMLPAGLATSATIILLTRVLWAPAAASVLDRSVRYTVDKTTREVLFLPLATELRQEVKPFVDVTGDRLSRGLIALVMLALIQPWGLGLQWYQLSLVSVGLAVGWFFLAVWAKREYLAGFRRSIDRQDVVPTEVRLNVADLNTVETLVEELANPDPRRVLYAIDLLESLDKRNLITPLLLHHESDEVRIRALAALEGARPDLAERWVPAIERLLKASNSEVRLAAVRSLADIRQAQVAELMRPYLEDRDPRVVVTAAMALADSQDERDVELAEKALKTVAEDTRQVSAAGRKEVAAAIAQIENPRFRHLLIPLFYDADVSVAQEAIRSARQLDGREPLFLPPLVSLLRNRQLKQQAREVLVSYGEESLDALAYFLKDPDEDIWVRRHIPGTLAQLPTQRSMDLLVSVLDDPDGFLRFKTVAAIEKLHREHPDLTIPKKPIEDLALRECLRYFNTLTLSYNLFRGEESDSLLARALRERLQRTRDRVFRLLGLIYPWKDIGAVRWTLDHSESRARASALEYLDNLLTGSLRKHVMPLVEDMPLDERVRKANVFVRSRQRDAEETLAQLIHDDDQVIAAAAIHYVEEKRLWTLADDLEHALAHRDVKDWYVFEAASWALAAYRLPAERRRALWMEPLPAVELANRLRRIPLFDYQSVDELFRIGSLGRQVRHENGRVLYQHGATADELQFLLDGRVSATTPGGETREIEAPAALAFEEVLEGSPVRETMRAVDSAIGLALGSDEFLTLLSNNSLLAQGLFGTLLADPARTGWQAVIRSRSPEEVARLAAGGLTPIERVFVLQETPIFSRLSADDLLALAGITRKVALAPGPLFAEADAPAIYMLLSGEVSLEPPQPGAPPKITTGDAIGVFETLGGEHAGRKAVVVQPGVALRIDRDDLFDLLGDRVGALQALFSALLRIEKKQPVAA